ncbi:hypothetical protein [Vibrio vulnificus]|uniref:hypothetical protein n=1 Tax=Vibrio vulnificus TaxID=672 RepID=UPI0034E06E65
MCGQEYIVRSWHGNVSVCVYGDLDKPALITYPDLALNRKSNSICSYFFFHKSFYYEF